MKPNTRRTFLRNAGISLALPGLDIFATDTATQTKQRMICPCTPLGLHPDNFIPAQKGKD